jgi:hypothetical protein
MGMSSHRSNLRHDCIPSRIPDVVVVLLRKHAGEGIDAPVDASGCVPLAPPLGTPAVDVDGEPRPRIQPRRTVPRPFKLLMGCGGSRWRRRNASSSTGGGVGRQRGSWRPPASPCHQFLQAPVRHRRWPFPHRGRERGRRVGRDRGAAGAVVSVPSSWCRANFPLSSS